MKLCMIGTGYVGLVSGVCFSDLGNDVICVDKDQNKINNLQKGIIPIYEPGLEELVRKNYKNKKLKFSTDLDSSIKKSDIVFICVGTPTKKNGIGADLSQIYSVSKEISKSINKFKIIITKSTVPVTTGDEIEKILLKKVNKNKFSVISNPEFLREGEAIRDFIYPDRVVIGANDKKSANILKSLYSPLISKGAKFISTNRRAAELIKYASNAFLATKITFINEIANLCEKTGIDVEDISIGIGLDKRIGSRFLRSGPGYGGSCFPKDTKAIISTADKFKTNLSVIKSVIKSNENRSKILLDRVNQILKNKPLNDVEKSVLLKTLIEEKIKEIESDKNNIKVNKTDVNKRVTQILSSYKLDELNQDKIKKYMFNKVEINMKWNKLITILFSKKLEINMNEIEENIKNKNIDIKKKEEMIKIEKIKSIPEINCVKEIK